MVVTNGASATLQSFVVRREGKHSIGIAIFCTLLVVVSSCFFFHFFLSFLCLCVSTVFTIYLSITTSLLSLSFLQAAVE